MNVNKEYGLVLGTLVHTDKGLIPIQNIKAGDMVLSRPKSLNDSNQNGYKRVVNALNIGKKELVRFTYCRDDDFEVHDADTNVLFMTRNYPIWAEETSGFIPVINFEPGAGIGNFEGQTDLTVLSIETVFGIENDGKAYSACAHPSFGNDDSDEIDMFIDFNREMYSIDLFNSNFKYVDVKYEEIDSAFKDIAFEAFCNNRVISVPVFTLEIEDNGTYFVGDKGLWVG